MNGDIRIRFVGFFALLALTGWITVGIFSATYLSLKSERWPQVAAQVTVSQI
jgi:nitrogen fixation/metabolism regulation signal transduction histidine kinase